MSTACPECDRSLRLLREQTYAMEVATPCPGCDRRLYLSTTADGFHVSSMDAVLRAKFFELLKRQRGDHAQTAFWMFASAVGFDLLVVASGHVVLGATLVAPLFAASVAPVAIDAYSAAAAWRRSLVEVRGLLTVEPSGYRR